MAVHTHFVSALVLFICAAQLAAKLSLIGTDSVSGNHSTITVLANDNNVRWYMNGLHSQVQRHIATRSQKSKNIIVFVSKRSPYGVLQYLTILLIIHAGDIELNPGPAGVRICKFPCGMCHKAVRCDHCRPAICCDNCSIWYHKDCMNICSAVYASISKPEASWICYKCGVPNLSTSLFDSYHVDTSNSFGLL